MEELITAVFVSHTRILTSINFSKSKKSIDLKIPKVTHFIHQCYIDVARSFWKSPYIFDDTISNFDYQRNRRDAEYIIEKSIGETIRKQLPVKHILKEYLGSEFKDENNEDLEFNDSEISTNYKENLRKMVKTEIENCSKEQLQNFTSGGANSQEQATDITVQENQEDSKTETIDITTPETSTYNYGARNYNSTNNTRNNINGTFYNNTNRNYNT